jgi:CyaY protein
MVPEMTPREFEESARNALLAVEEAIDEIDADEIDVDGEENVITIGFAGGDRFVLNVNGPAREIWLSANRRAWHFAPRAGDRFVSTAADGEEMMACLGRLIGEKLGRPIALGD